MTKEKLLKYVKIKAELGQVKEKLDEVESTYKQVRAMNYDGMPKSSSPIKDSFAEVIARLDILRESYNSKLNCLLQEQIEIETIIDKLENEERVLMRKRYIDGLIWEDVCEQMNYSLKTIHRMHNKILDKLS